MQNTRLLVLNSLLKVNYGEGYSNIVIDKALRKANLTGRDAAFVTAIFYGVLERRITLDYIISQCSKVPLNKISHEILEILRMAVYQALYMDKVPESAIVNESVNLAKLKKQAKAAGFVNALLRTFLRKNKSYKEPDSVLEQLSVEYSCPMWIIELFMSSYGKTNTIEILRASFGKPPINIRVNTLKTTPQNLSEQLQKEGVDVRSISLVDEALELNSGIQFDKLRNFNEGLFHVQDLASQICCKILSPKPGQVVIDVCAAPGGKTFTLAEMMKNRGKLFAFDQYEAKVNLIKSGAKRLGLSIVTAEKRDASNLSADIPKADKVLCDVPCSGLGILKRKPEIKYKKENFMKDLPEVQYKILCEASKFVKPKGTLLYSTCTLNLAENNQLADKFLSEHEEFIPKKIAYDELNLAKNDFDKDNQLTLMPHIHGTDGFFIAAFEKAR